MWQCRFFGTSIVGTPPSFLDLLFEEFKAAAVFTRSRLSASSHSTIVDRANDDGAERSSTMKPSRATIGEG